ncbi:hypothetical protein U0070_010336, partial [Myodes glareolus]
LRPPASSRLRSNERLASRADLTDLCHAGTNGQAQSRRQHGFRQPGDVIEGVRDLFAEEGIEEQVLKDLKKLWETKVLQSKATENFFRNSVHSSLFTLQLPQALPTLQSTGW